MLNRLRRAVSLARRPLARPNIYAGAGAGELGVDVEEFLRVARQSFVCLQAAWDAGDLDSLARLTTAPLLQDLREQLQARGDDANQTHVLTLQAELLAFEELREAWFASVEFTGLIRERSEDGAAPFRELWLLAKPKLGGGAWQLARVQALS